MGPGPALDAFLHEAPKSYLGVGPDGEAAPGRYDRVGIVLRDRGELRALRVTKGVRSAAIAVWLDEGVSALSLTPRPEWPALQMIRSRAVDGGWLTILRFASPLPVHRVIEELARQSVWPDRVGHRGLVTDDEATDKVAADAIELVEPDPILELGPLDERILNPIGFTRAADGPVLELAELDWGRGPTEALVRGVRKAQGVRAELPQAPPLRAARVIAGLAMAGVPLTAEQVAAPIAARLGAEVTAAITAPVDLGNPQAREEHSVVLRRAALTTFSSAGWRKRLGDLAGVRVAHQPSISVVMATRRPDLLDHALSQVARQRGVERLELVLAPHGFDPDPGVLARYELDVRLAPQPPEMIFGDVLYAACQVASGDVVVKMDDDDWYAPDAIADLLLARAYSGAELVGMPDDVYYLEPDNETIRLGQRSEVYRQFVAGGTLMLDRGLLREVGSFRSVPRHVDAELIVAVRAAGGTTYRTHGLGYVLRRTDAGHTWQAGVAELRARAVETVAGFAPSRLLEL